MTEFGEFPMPKKHSRKSTHTAEIPHVHMQPKISTSRVCGVSCKVCMIVRDSLLGILFTIFCLPYIHAVDKEMARDEAQFDIYIAGTQIGKEKFAVLISKDSVSTHSSADLHNLGDKHQNIEIKTELKADSLYKPLAYQVHTEIDGQKGSIIGRFSEGQAMFEFSSDGNPSKRGLLVGDRYIILDTNVFHHFIFVARLFDLDSNEESQSFEVIVPQELNNGILNVSEAGIEKIQVSGKNRILHHLKADSGVVSIDLWIDDRGILYKIALPDKHVEVIRH
jgi:hypothetical protein